MQKWLTTPMTMMTTTIMMMMANFFHTHSALLTLEHPKPRVLACGKIIILLCAWCRQTAFCNKQNKAEEKPLSPATLTFSRRTCFGDACTITQRTPVTLSRWLVRATSSFRNLEEIRLAGNFGPRRVPLIRPVRGAINYATVEE